MSRYSRQFKVGEMYLSVEPRQLDSGRWTWEWLITRRGEGGRWLAEKHGVGTEAESGQFVPPEFDIPPGLKEARELQQDHALPFTEIDPVLTVNVSAG